MKRQHKNEPQSVPVSLVWRFPAQGPLADETPGALHATESEPRPAPQQVETLKLRAWFYCSQCRTYQPTPKGYGTSGYCGGTGYGNDCTTGAPVCYRCCAENDRKSMAETGRATLYLTRETQDPEPRLPGTRAPLKSAHWRVSNWPGSMKFPVMSMKRNAHNWRNVERVDVWFISGGYVWHGVNLGDSQILRCKRTRAEWRQRPYGDGYHAVTPRKSRAKPRESGIPAGSPVESSKSASDCDRLNTTHGPGR